jgi:hypothetical protein
VAIPKALLSRPSHPPCWSPCRAPAPGRCAWKPWTRAPPRTWHWRMPSRKWGKDENLRWGISQKITENQWKNYDYITISNYIYHLMEELYWQKCGLISANCTEMVIVRGKMKPCLVSNEEWWARIERPSWKTAGRDCTCRYKKCQQIASQNHHPHEDSVPNYSQFNSN